MNLDEDLDALVDEEKAKSLKEGIEAGKAQGLQEGKAQGLQQSKIEIAKKMLSKGMPLDLIVEMTGLSEE